MNNTKQGFFIPKVPDKDKKKVDDFIRYCIEQKIPLYLLMVISNSKSMVDKLFSPKDEFKVSLMTTEASSMAK